MREKWKFSSQPWLFSSEVFTIEIIRPFSSFLLLLPFPSLPPPPPSLHFKLRDSPRLILKFVDRYRQNNDNQVSGARDHLLRGEQVAWLSAAWVLFTAFSELCNRWRWVETLINTHLWFHFLAAEENFSHPLLNICATPLVFQTEVQIWWCASTADCHFLRCGSIL